MRKTLTLGITAILGVACSPAAAQRDALQPDDARELAVRLVGLPSERIADVTFLDATRVDGAEDGEIEAQATPIWFTVVDCEGSEAIDQVWIRDAREEVHGVCSQLRVLAIWNRQYSLVSQAPRTGRYSTQHRLQLRRFAGLLRRSSEHGDGPFTGTSCPDQEEVRVIAFGVGGGPPERQGWVWPGRGVPGKAGAL